MGNYVYVLIRDAYDVVGVFETKDDALEHREIDIMQQADHDLLYQLSDYKVRLIPFYKAK